jgi:hypothetical protein
MLYYSTNKNVKTICKIRADRRNKRNFYFEVVRANGGSCNGYVEYTLQFSKYEDAFAELKRIYDSEESYCTSHQGAWHSENLYKVTVNGYGDEVSRELV